VQHAHQKGIIHRDLKPSNVMVTEVDGRPTPKVIDFGVAKATEVQLTDQSLGDTGAIVGTPTYMSPEQADPSSMDVDTRTDVYALGVILYELLAGSPPIDAKQFKRGAILEMLRMVREVDPPRPSTKVSTSDALPSIAASRDIEPAQLKRTLTGDLDWIVMKALEKDRTRRYDTANGFAADVLRHLAYEPVVAAPPSRAYRLRKFVRKHRGAVIAASLVLFALLAGIVGTTLGLIEVDARRWEAETNLAFATKGNEILGSVFEGLDPTAAYATLAEFRNALRDNLSKAVRELDGAAIGNPLIVATMQGKLGMSLIALGEPNEATVVLKKSAETRKAKLGADHPDTLSSMYSLASAYLIAGKPDLALPLCEETLKLRKAKLGTDHPDTIVSINDLALAYEKAGKLDLALPLYEEALKLMKAKHGPDHRDTLITTNNLAVAYLNAGKPDLAVPLLKESLSLMKAKLGPDNPYTLTSMNSLAGAYEKAGKLDLALPLYEETLKLRKAKLGADHPDTLVSMNGVAMMYKNSGKLDLAVPLLEEALKLFKAKLGTDHPYTFGTMNNLAGAYTAVGKLDLALPLYEETLKLHKANLGPDHPGTFFCTHNVAAAYEKAGKLDLALPLYEETLKLRKVKLGPDNPETLRSMASFGNALSASKDFTRAEPLLRECLATSEKTQPYNWRTFNTQSLLGAALFGQKKYADAEPLLLKGYEGMKQREKAIPRPSASCIPEALDRLVGVYTATNKPDEVKKWQAERAKYPTAASPPQPKK
jgi:tetratricopeptide (TPR) repeat protein